MGITRAWMLLTVLLMLCRGMVFAQSTGAINGRIVEQQGNIVSGVTVTATEVNTSAVRRTVTNDAGLYNLPSLEPGRYDIEASQTGFATSVQRNVTLVVAQTLTINFSLSVSSVKQSVTVSATAPLFESTQSEVKGSITEQDIEGLPLVTRDFQNLVALIPGAKTADIQNPTKQNLGGMSFSGSGGRNANVVVDGGDDRDDVVGGLLQDYTIEGIAEFTLLTHQFSAAEGRASGAELAIVSKSGSNELHGSGFIYERNQALEATDYFSQTANGGQGKPPFSRQQFGGSVGGPIRKDRLFFFAAYEQVRQETSATVPAALFSEMELLAPVVPTVKPLREVSEPFDNHLLTAKLDTKISDTESGILRFSLQRNQAINNQSFESPITSRDQSAPTYDRNSTQGILASWTSVLSPRKVNVFLVQYAGGNPYDLIDSTSHPPITGNLVFPSVQTGLGTSEWRQFASEQELQFHDGFSVQLGAHALTFGGDYTWFPVLGGQTNNFAYGALQFFDDPSTILTDKTKYPEGFQTPGIVNIAYLSNALETPGSYFTPNAQRVDGYIQDDWKATRRLTLNLGVRTDVSFNFLDQSELSNNRTYPILKEIGARDWPGRPPGDQGDLLARLPPGTFVDVSPRIGFAYDPAGKGRTVIRGGYGIYFDPGAQTETIGPIFQSKPDLFSISVLFDPAIGVGPLATYQYGISPPPPFPGMETSLPPNGFSTGSWIDPNFKDAYSEQFHIGVAQQLAANNSLSVDFTHILGLNEPRTHDINYQVNGVGILEPELAAIGEPGVFSDINIVDSVNRSQYNELSVRFKRSSRWVNFEADYTLSSAYAFGGSIQNTLSPAPQDPNNYFAPIEWGPTRTDERHRLVAYGVFRLPFGIEVAPILQLASARPYQLYSGAVLYGTTQGYYVNPTTGLPVGTDSQRGTPLKLLDIGVTKYLTFGSSERKVALTAQFFNVGNATNFGDEYNGNALGADFEKPNGYYPGIGYPFEVQLGARFTF
jgi:Carboxypeptidase regulatory-like domain